jgi:DNA-3-methyladenine glycosylase
VVVVRLVEVEAYGDESDPASHAWRGPTPRTAVMYGSPGIAYVYRSYGIHWCLNVVCGPPGRPAAVLLRAGEVVSGLELARRRRGDGTPESRLSCGPGNLAQSLGLTGAFTGVDLTSGVSPLTVRSGTPVASGDVVHGTRIGIRRAADTPWRFWERGNPHVSGPRRAEG